MTARDEERQAVVRRRALEKARKVRASRADLQRAALIREELAQSRAKNCRCGIKPTMTLHELKALGAGCTAGLWVCPTLDTIRRKLGH